MEDSLSVRAVEDLRGETVMAPEGSATAQELRTDYPFIRVDEGGDVFTCLKKLMRNRHRFIVYHDIGLFGAINALELEDQVRAFLVLDQYEHYVAVRKTLPDDVKKRIEQALNTLREQGRLAAISASYIHNAPVREQ
jgi:ABC-type amino acid transport substrate-binding protein